MNQIATINPAIPAFLQARAARLVSSNSAIAGGIRGGEGHPRISIKGSRWRLNDATGAETIHPELTLNVIVVGANPALSKQWYEGAYNPADTEAKGPDCFSDNGTGPSAQSLKPQSDSCSTCRHNIWGSRINPNGAKSKACADSKKLAVILADNPTGSVYELRVPAASMANLAAVAKMLDDKATPMGALVMRLAFDPAADYPKITFTPASYINEAQAAAADRLEGSAEVDKAVGLGDATAKPALIEVKAPVQETPAFLGHPDPEPAPAKSRGRPKKEEPAAAAVSFLDQPAATPAAAVQSNPAPTSAEMDALLNGINFS